MTFSEALRAYFTSDQVGIALLLIALDFVLGVCAALKIGTFRLAYLADFGRNDIAFKLVPWAAVDIGARIAQSQGWAFSAGGIDIDLAFAADAFFAIVVAAWVGSIVSSLKALGVPIPLPKAITGEENAAPPKD